MQRGRIEIIKPILTSEYWLLFSLAGVFFCFFAYGAGANFFLNLCGIFLIIEFLIGNYQIKKISRWYLVFAAICAYLVLASVLNPYAYSKLRYIKRLARMVIIVFAIHCLSQKDVEDRIVGFFSGLLAVSVCWQFAARYVYVMPFGTYRNPHFLASFAALALPLIVYFIWAIRGWYKFIFVSVGILDGYLLLQIGSFPSYLAVLCGALFLFMFLTRGWYKWLCIILILTSLATIYVTDYPITKYSGNAFSIQDLILSLSKEERVQIWADVLKMLKDNSLIAWIVGNGIGSFHSAFSKYSVPEYSSFVFPHNFFLEVLYESGLLGFVLIFGGLGTLFSVAMIKVKKMVNKRRSILLKCMIILFLIWFIYCNLVFPIYANYTLIPLGFILGIMLVLLEKIRRTAVLNQDIKA